MTPALDTPVPIQLTLLGSDTWILDMAKPPEKKTDETKTKPLPWHSPFQPYNGFLLEMLYLREQLSLPREYEGGVSDEKRKKFKRDQA